MSELSVGSLSGLAANSYVIDVASGSQLTQPGMVLQVVQGTSTTTTTTTSSTYEDTNLTATITPTSATSKILIIATGTVGKTNVIGQGVYLRLFRGDTATGTGLSGDPWVTNEEFVEDTFSRVPATLMYLDSPATTSATTYTVGIKITGGGITGQFRYSQHMVLMEIAG